MSCLRLIAFNSDLDCANGHIPRTLSTLTGEHDLYHNRARANVGDGLAEDSRSFTRRMFVLAKIKDESLVQLEVHFCFEGRLHANTIDHFENAEKDGVLPRLAKALHYLMDAPQALRFADVVTNEIAATHRNPPASASS